MPKYRVRGKLTVTMYVTVDCNTEERAIREAFGKMDDEVTDSLHLEGVDLEHPEIDIQEAREIK